MPENPLTFDANDLYIILADIGAETQLHWAFYFATTSSTGTIFHLINTPETGGKWQYQTKSSQDVPSSINLLVAVKIAVLEPVLHGAFAERLTQIPTDSSSRYRENITCRVWLKETLYELDNEGYIGLVKSVEYVEDEARMLAAENKPRDIRSVVTSSGCII